MFFTIVLIGIILFILLATIYIYRQISYRDWLKTDDGLLQTSLDELQRNPKDIEALRLSASLFYKKQDYKKAFDYYSQMILLTSPNMSDHLSPEGCFNVYLEFGLSAHQTEKFEDALISLQKARRTLPGAVDQKLSATLGFLIFQKSHLADAVVELETAHKLNPRDKSNNFVLGMCYAKLGRFKEALLLLRPLEPENKEDPEFILALANCLAKAEQFEQAIEYYKCIVENETVGAMACGFLAHLYLRQNNTAEALKYFEKVPSMDTPVGELTYQALYASAKTYVKLGKFHEACESLQRLCNLNSKYQDANVLLNNYREVARSHSLNLLYYGENEQRGQVLRQLLQLLIPGLNQINSETYNRNHIVMTAKSFNKQNERMYYVWINLVNGPVTMEKVREIVNQGKLSGCNRYMLITNDTFDDQVESFSEVRPIELIEGVQLREKLLKIDGNG